MTAFSPGASPPPVQIPIRWIVPAMSLSGLLTGSPGGCQALDHGGGLALDDQADALFGGVPHEGEAGVLARDRAFVQHVVHQLDEMLPERFADQDEREWADFAALDEGRR